MSENEISYLIRGAIFKVIKKLGPGLFENVYQHILKVRTGKTWFKCKNGSTVASFL
ncbi:GxxExxY protein [Ferruginibacter sp.]